MVKYPVFVTLIVSGIWLSSREQVAEALVNIRSPLEDAPEGISSNLAAIEPLTVIAGVLLVLAIVGFALALIFMAAHKYSQWLNREMPQPVYTQETRLLKVVGDSAKAIIQEAMGKDRVNGQEREIQVGIVEFERTGKAGVNLKLNSDTVFTEDSGKKLYRQLQTWQIEADRWGRIRKMSQEGLPRYIVTERAPGDEGDKGKNGKEAENGQQKQPPNGLLPPGDDGWIDSLMTRSDTLISIITRRRHWAE